MFVPRSLRIAPILAFLLFCCIRAHAQRELGELHLEVQDQQGAPVPAAAELTSDANQLRRNFSADADGRATAQDLPFGLYRLSITHAGFASKVQAIEIRSEVPLYVKVTLGLASVETQVQVSASETLVDPNRTSTVAAIGSQMIEEELPSQPGRGLLDLVNSLPGWIYEANGVLHPRESEYQVQFVVDGLPLTENRSPAFAAPFEAEESDSVRVRPSLSLDAGAGVDLYRRDLRTLSFLVQTGNLTNRLNVINFESLFSGSAIGAPRSVSARLRATF